MYTLLVSSWSVLKREAGSARNDVKFRVCSAAWYEIETARSGTMGFNRTALRLYNADSSALMAVCVFSVCSRESLSADLIIII
jgi:hypothetical protein